MHKPLVSALTALLTLAGAGAQADMLSWEIKSDYPYRLQLEFYSQDRNHVWPGGGQAYVLDDWDFHRFDLECVSGEKICYGAWVDTNPDRYWGSGLDDQHGCSDCCAFCGGGTVDPITLIE